MCMSECFYERFEDYKYMMIYHTDACIFRDKIKEFINLGYNWYGAPIQNAHYLYNGGFNIRNIEKCKEVCVFTKDKIDFYRNYCINEDIVFSVALGNLLPRGVAIQFSWECFLSGAQVNEYLALTNNQGPMGCHNFKKDRFLLFKPFIKKEILDKYEGLV